MNTASIILLKVVYPTTYCHCVSHFCLQFYLYLPFSLFYLLLHKFILFLCNYSIAYPYIFCNSFSIVGIIFPVLMRMIYIYQSLYIILSFIVCIYVNNTAMKSSLFLILIIYCQYLCWHDCFYIIVK